MSNKLGFFIVFMVLLGCDQVSDPIEIEPPIPPSNLQLEQVSPTSIRLSWVDNSDDEEGFGIDRKIGTESWAEAYAIVSENHTEWSDTVAIPEEENTYRLYAFKDTANSVYIENSIIPLYPDPTILLVGPEQDISLGEHFGMSVLIQDFKTPFFAVSLRISYDSLRLSYQPADTSWIGDVWSGNAIGITEMEGELIYSSITQIAGDDLVSDNGELLSIDFVAEMTGMAAFELLSEALILYSENGSQIFIQDLVIQSDSVNIE